MRYLLLVLTVVFFVSCSAPDEKRWYRGNTHTHSLWSDGNDFPEMIVGWYKERGYDFIALSDHNILAVDEKWRSLDYIVGRQNVEGPSAFEKYMEKYPEDWIETRETDGLKEVRLKRIDEYRVLFEEPEEFLVLQAEEISNKSLDKPVHLNVINLPGGTIVPGISSDASVRELMRQNLRAVAKMEKATGQPILVHLNHPNFQWGVTAEDLAHVVEEQFFEVYNGHPGINHLGDADRPGDERIWDIANTIRLAELDAEPLFGIATDDSHHYHGGPVSPGRGWIMVHASELDGNALVEAMRTGDFYSSTGVYLDSIDYDSGQRILTIEIQPVEGVSYTTQLIGTRSSYRASAEDYTGIGEVLAEQAGTQLSFIVSEDVLYARATITSTVPHPNPSFENQMEQAWVQPVGWRR